MGKTNGPSWWKMFAHQRAIMEAMPDADVGAALKASFRYFDGEELGELSPMAAVAFASVKPYLDESREDYQKKVSYGKKGGAKRWNTDKQAP